MGQWRGPALRAAGLPEARAAAAADAVAAEQIAAGRKNIVIHYSAPVSPVLPGYGSKLGVPVVIGPINGNIFYPPGFRHRESAGDRVRRVFHPPLQWGHRMLFSGKQTADALLVAGGERTYQSLRMAGCRDEQFVDAIDSGIPERLLHQPRVRHSGQEPAVRPERPAGGPQGRRPGHPRDDQDAQPRHVPPHRPGADPRALH